VPATAAKIDMALWRQCLLAIPHQPIPPRSLPFRCRDVDGCTVLIVHGDRTCVRPDKPGDDDAHPHMDFNQGANDLEAAWVRREFGKKVLLLDHRGGPQQWAFDLYHEAMERRYMAKGDSYNVAHNKTNPQERQLRIMAMQARMQAVAGRR
jgi:hypothetical protein